MTKTCRLCGIEFETNNNQKIICTRKCKDKHYRSKMAHAFDREPDWGLHPRRRHNSIGRLSIAEFNILDALGVLDTTASKGAIAEASGMKYDTVDRVLRRCIEVGIVECVVKRRYSEEVVEARYAPTEIGAAMFEEALATLVIE